jgi:MFS family permease
MWVPSLMIASSGPIPTGLVFSSFMLSMTFGGMLFSLILPIFPGEAEGLSIFLYLLSAISMIIPIYYFDFWSILGSFLLLEAMVGMFNSCGGTLRSRYYPEGKHSSIMSVFRLPLNLLVVMGTKFANRANDVKSLQFVFGMIVAMHLIATGLQLTLVMLSKKSKVKEI